MSKGLIVQMKWRKMIRRQEVTPDKTPFLGVDDVERWPHGVDDNHHVVGRGGKASHNLESILR
jgi:hypothetical protein